MPGYSLHLPHTASPGTSTILEHCTVEAYPYAVALSCDTAKCARYQVVHRTLEEAGPSSRPARVSASAPVTCRKHRHRTASHSARASSLTRQQPSAASETFVGPRYQPATQTESSTSCRAYSYASSLHRAGRAGLYSICSDTMMSQKMLVRARLCLICLSVAANAICAGGIYCFPLISPALAVHMKLDQPQLTTIALAGMIGQYPIAAFVGKVIDRYGPWSCSLIASLLFSVGFGLFSWEVGHAPSEVTEPSVTSFRRLVMFFGMAGLGTVFSYFSLVFAATKTFPAYIGIASGTSMALFGLSPLFLSMIASHGFTDSDAVLDLPNFFAFMAILTGVVHLCGALALPGPTHAPKTATPTPSTRSFEEDDDVNSDEIDPLLPSLNKPDATVEIVPVPEPHHGTTIDLLKDPYFWLLAVIVALVVGAAEMVISNMGSIVSSLSTASSASRHISTQVQLLSIFNTASRLIVGPLADFVSPVASYLPNGVWAFPRRHFVSRVVFLIIASILLASTFIWLVVGVRSPAAVWVLSVGTGTVYGTTFTLLPSIMASIWGLQNLGRNFGIISYAAFIGTPIFSYLFAFVVAQHTTSGDGVCKGAQCWQLTFGMNVGTTLVAVGLTIRLWRRWRDRV